MKQLDEKILDEIRKRVIETDRELREKREFTEMEDATIEALKDMTTLTEKEIDAIAGEVHKDVVEEEKDINKKKYGIFILILFIAMILPIILIKIKVISFIIVGAIAITLVLAVIKYVDKTRERKILIDYFNKENIPWAESHEIKQRRFFKDDKYYFECGVKGYCYREKMPVELPENYTVEIRTEWIKGVYDEFDFMLYDDKNNFIRFEAIRKGKASYSIRINKKYVKELPWKTISVSQKNNVQKVVVEGRNFKYYLNDLLAHEGDFDKLGEFTDLAIRVCDKQTVAFDSILITDNDTNKVVFEEDFNPPKKEWKPKEDFNYKKKVSDKGYIIEHNRENWCSWSSHEIEAYRDCDITLRARWISGESNYFGLMVYEGKDAYTFFRVKSSGEASYNKHDGEKYAFTGSTSQAGYESQGDNSVNIIVKIRNRNFTYFINDFLVAKGKLNVSKINRVGVRVCDIQEVIFEKIIIEEV